MGQGKAFGQRVLKLFCILVVVCLCKYRHLSKLKELDCPTPTRKEKKILLSINKQKAYYGCYSEMSEEKQEDIRGTCWNCSGRL
jgi:hypothetical protein